MLYTGSIINEQHRLCEVEIITDNDSSQITTIGENEIYFSDTDPITLEMGDNKITDVILRQSGVLRILTPEFIPDLFRADFAEARVTIKEGGNVCFKGFILPRTYTQEFNSVIDSLEINVIDRLTALQWKKWGDVGSAGIDYNTLRAEASSKTIGEILNICFEAVGISSEEVRFLSEPNIISGTNAREGVLINESVFLSDSEEDVWTLETVLEETLRYLNLHIADTGEEVIVFDWKDIKADKDTITASLDNVYGCNTSIEIEEIYNRFKVVCETQGEEDILKDPLDDDECTSPYTKPHHYLRQYNLNVPPPVNADYLYFGKLLWGMNYPDVISNETWIRDYWIRVLENPGWTFYRYDEKRTPWDCAMPIPEDLNSFKIYGKDEQNGVNEWSLPERIKEKNGAGLLGIITGKQEQRPDNYEIETDTDSSKVMVIHVGGDNAKYNWPYPNTTWEGEDAEAFLDKCKRSAPRAIWRGGSMNLSPADDKTIRYLDISGKITLVPVEPQSEKWSDVQNFKLTHPSPTEDTYKEIVNFCGTKIKGEKKEGKRMAFMHQYFRDETPTPDIEDHTGLGGSLWFYQNAPGFQFYESGETQEIERVPELDYSRIIDGQAKEKSGTLDRVTKLGVLICAMTVGNKCLCETVDPKTGATTGYRWEDIKEGKVQTFTIGFDVKPGDYLMGKEYPIAKNLPYTKLLDIKGTAIPIRSADRLQGDVRFYIIGPAFLRFFWGMPCNSRSYQNESYKPGEDIEITEYNIEELEKISGGNILRKVESIWLRDFNIKLVSDNAGNDPLQECDLVYTSETDESYSNEHDDITFRIISDLTAEERETIGVPDALRPNTAIDNETQKGITAMCFKGERIKPEQYCVQSLYEECSQPKIKLSQSFRAHIPNPFCLIYKHPALLNPLYPIGYSRNIKQGVITLNLREIK